MAGKAEPAFAKAMAGKVAHLVEHDLPAGGSGWRIRTKMKVKKVSSLFISREGESLSGNSGSSSFGRARPCQGRGGRFEPGLPLSIPDLRDFLLQFISLLSCVDCGLQTANSRLAPPWWWNW